MQLTLASRLVAAPSVVTRDVGGDLMLLDLDSGTYFGLDPVGSEIWQAAEDDLSLGEMCDRLQPRYDVSRQQLEQDVLALAEQLVAQRLAAPR
ncbi:MAG: PqqD family protein [Pseudomonadota bacterium]